MRIVIWLGIVLLALAGAAAGYVFLWPVPIDPVAWTPGPDPGLTGPYAKNETLKLRRLGAGGKGPEDVELGPDGLIYAGLEDGRIVRFPRSGRPIEVFASTGGRPLGLRFDGFGNLIVADAEKGLLTVGRDGGVERLVDALDGQPIGFVNNLDIAPDSTIYFTASSMRHGLDDGLNEALEGRATGRLFRFNPATRETRLLAEGLRFANGVALAPDASFAVVAETFGYRLTRVWLSGPKAGTSEPLLEHLPGFPDNVSYDAGAGLFWVAMVAPRVSELDAAAGDPDYRRILYRLVQLPFLAPPAPQGFGWVIAVDAAGTVVHNLQTHESGYASVTGVKRFGDELYLGSITMDQVGIAAAP